MLKLWMACSTLQEPSEGQKPLGARKGPGSARFWRTIHLAALRYSVCAEQAVQEDRGQFCYLVPVDGGLGHAVDSTLQIQSESVLVTRGTGVVMTSLCPVLALHVSSSPPLHSHPRLHSIRRRADMVSFSQVLASLPFCPKELSSGICCRKFQQKQVYCLYCVKFFFLNRHYYCLALGALSNLQDTSYI